MTSIKPTIYLIKDNIKEPKQIFKKSYRLIMVEKDEAVLFYRASQNSTPDWANYLSENFEVSTKPFKNSSSYAVIVLKIDNRLLAIPLGMGLHLLDLTKIEYNFGLKTAINCIPKAEIRQIDTTTPETNSQKTKKQAVTGSTPEDFGINKQKDILRGIVGKLPKNHELGDALEGKDSLRLSKNVEGFMKLKSLAKKVLEHFASTHYKTDYPWIDNIAMVRDKSLIEKLTKTLVKALKYGKFEDMFFSPPVYYEMIFDFNGFIFSTGDGKRIDKKETFEMPDMLDWKNSVGTSIKEISLENLDKFKVNLVSDTQKKEQDWPLQRCLSWETDLEGKKYILSEGSWYAVESSFFDEVEDFYGKRILSAHSLPRPSKSKIKESIYNEEISKAIKDSYLFDLGSPKSSSFSLGKDRNEACDVFDVKEKTFIHVKMGKSSPSLSHLFRQGAFSAQLLKQDLKSRDEFRKHFTTQGCKTVVINEPYVPSEFRILFAVVLGKKQKKNIPFFSKVSFRDIAENVLELMGHECRLTYVDLP